MILFPRGIVRTAFGVALAVVLGWTSDAEATQTRICSLGGIKHITVLDDRNIFALPQELLKYGTWACVEIGAGVAFNNSPTTHYLGFLNTGTGERQLGIFAPDGKDSSPIFSGSLEFGPIPNILFPNNPASMEFGFSATSFTSDTLVPVLNPQGNRLLIIGTGVDPFGPGLDIGPGAGDFNEVHDLHHSRSINRFQIYSQYNMPIVGGRNSTAVAALLRIGYTRQRNQGIASGFLPNVPLEFYYAENFTVNTFTPAVGLHIIVPLVRGDYEIDAFGKFLVGPAITYVSGSDRFGFNGAVNGEQIVDLSDNHVGFGWMAIAGLTVGDHFSVTGSFSRDKSSATVFRSGETGDRSHVSIDDENVWSVMMRWQRNFYP